MLIRMGDPLWKKTALRARNGACSKLGCLNSTAKCKSCAEYNSWKLQPWRFRLSDRKMKKMEETSSKWDKNGVVPRCSKAFSPKSFNLHRRFSCGSNTFVKGSPNMSLNTLTRASQAHPTRGFHP